MSVSDWYAFGAIKPAFESRTILCSDFSLSIKIHLGFGLWCEWKDHLLQKLFLICFLSKNALLYYRSTNSSFCSRGLLYTHKRIKLYILEYQRSKESNKSLIVGTKLTKFHRWLANGTRRSPLDFHWPAISWKLSPLWAKRIELRRINQEKMFRSFVWKHIKSLWII